MSAGEFAVVTRDELWSLAERPTLLERRLIHGIAEQRGSEITASDARDEACDRASEAAMDGARARMLGAGVTTGLLRIVASSRNEGALRTGVICTLAMRGMSVVSDPEHYAADAALLERCARSQGEEEVDPRALPVVWRNGSAAVLFHEAVGHAAEFGHEPLDLPPGFRVEAPLAMRRASFTDAPLLRMEHVRVWYGGDETRIPPRRIEVNLVAGGHYETLTQVVTVRVASAELVDRTGARAVKPFSVTAHRRELVRSIRGALGPVERYPGVVCSREGQDLFVASFAPVIVTEL